MKCSALALRLSCAALAVVATGCQSKATAGAHASATESAPAAAQASETRRFGAPVPAGTAMSLSNVLAKPDQFENQSVIVEATVRRNCTRRGCWMELAEAMAPDSPGCRVTFKDYGFFVPLDSAGSTARVQGTVQVRTVSEPEVAHLEGEGARFAAKQADGTAREVRMVATGVELSRGPS